MTGFRILFVLVIAVFVASCVSIHTGQVGSVSSSSISEKDVVFKDVVFGYSHAHYFFGLGGNRKSTLTADALKNLQRSKPLDNGEYFDNITYNTKFTIFPFLYFQNEVLVVADLLQSDSVGSRTYSQDFLEQLNTNQLINEYGFKLNEKVKVSFNFNYYYGKVVNVKKKSVRIAYLTKRGFYRVKRKSNKNVFYYKENQISDSLAMGDTIIYRDSYQTPFRSIIEGYNNNYFLTRPLDIDKEILIKKIEEFEVSPN